MSVKRRRLLGVGRVLLGLAVGAFALSRPETRALLPRLLENAWVLLPAAAGAFLAGAVEAQRLCLLLRSQGFELGFGASYRLGLIGAFFNNFVPGGTGGDLVKMLYLATDHRGRGVEVASWVMLDRLCALFAMLLLTLGFAAAAPESWEHGVVRVLLLVAGAALLVLGAILFGGAAGILTRLPGYAFLVQRGSLGERLQRLVEALASSRGARPVLVRAVGLALLAQAVPLALFVYLAQSLGAEASLPTLVAFALLGLLANALPLTPGGLGIGEEAFRRLFLLVGFGGGATLILSWRAALLPASLVGGLLYLLGRRGTGEAHSRSM